METTIIWGGCTVALLNPKPCPCLHCCAMRLSKPCVSLIASEQAGLEVLLAIRALGKSKAMRDFLIRQEDPHPAIVV